MSFGSALKKVGKGIGKGTGKVTKTVGNIVKSGMINHTNQHGIGSSKGPPKDCRILAPRE